MNPPAIVSTLLKGIAKKAVVPTALTGAGILGGLAVAAIAGKRKFVPDIFNASGYLVFPEDLERFQISMRFEFMEYQRRSIFSQTYQKAKEIIRLPVPKNIVDKFQVAWQEEKDQPIVGAVLESILDKNPSSQANQLLSFATGQMSNVAAVGPAAVLNASQWALNNNPLGITMDKVLQPFGMAVNPFLTVLFKQPNFKRYNFSWKLIPKNPDEAARINGIIQTFKYNMLPDLAMRSAGSILNYPNMMQISFYGIDNYLYRFKPCVIESLEVNYAPQGVSFFKGEQNVPTEIDLQITLLEIEYWTKQDFEPGKNYIPNEVNILS